MDNSRKQPANSDDIEAQPQWPQRPNRPQPSIYGPRLQPPPERKSDSGVNGVNNSGQTYRGVQARAQQPSGTGNGSNNGNANGNGNKPVDPKATQVLPIVEPSRFYRAAGPNQAPQTEAPKPPRNPGQTAAKPNGQVPVKPVPDASSAPYRPQAIQTASAKRSSIDMPSEPPVGVQPQVRKPGGWQYEREEEAGPEGYVPGGKGARVYPDHSRSYLAVSVGAARKRRMNWVLWPLGIILAVALIGGTAFALAWQGQYAGKIYGGVSILGQDMGGQTPDAAKKILNDKMQSFVAQPIVLTWRGKEWRPSAEQLGVNVDVDATVDEAFKVGRSADVVSNVGQQWAATGSGYKVPLTVEINEPAMQAYLQSVAGSDIDQKLFEGDIRLNGDKVESLPGVEGRSLRVYDAVHAVSQQVAKLEQGKVELPVDTVQPSVTAQEVQYVQGLLEVRISGPITATAPGKVETLDRAAIIRFTTIQRNPDRNASRHIDLGWNDAQLKILADRWAQETNHAAQNARFAWNNGAVAVLKESSEGFQTDANSVIAGIKEAAGTSDKREFALPGKVLTPAVSSKDIGALGIKEPMGQGLSTFKGSSPERATNITVAANLLNGAVIPPGGTFSFLDTMGGIDEAHGFVPGYVIAAERTQLGVGGGVCQVSTTTFRAAFWSGLKITERNQHSYRVGWYEANGEPVGFDAAVFDPGVDLRVVNDSPGFVLIQAVVTPDTLTVTFYGTKTPGQEVKLDGPVISNRQPAPPDVYEVDTRLPAGTKKQVETAHAGLNTLITRHVTAPGQPEKVDQFSSAYQPWSNWYVVASPSQIPPGAKTATP